MLLTSLTSLLALAATAHAAAWGSLCNPELRTGGVCDSVGTCNSFGGKPVPGFCPGLPGDVQCCVTKHCMPARACPVLPKSGHCPGGADIKLCPGYRAFCSPKALCDKQPRRVKWTSGYCPGGSDFRLCVIRA
ncbi:hypothetical protein Q8F55_006254 [Vanrija albida]|uniref:Uncharacterized protein n=1 Tax=Vanrija albida TaxID=181172 RepID=A0ABR3PWJ8_9TREE